MDAWFDDGTKVEFGKLYEFPVGSNIRISYAVRLQDRFRLLNLSYDYQAITDMHDDGRVLRFTKSQYVAEVVFWTGEYTNTAPVPSPDGSRIAYYRNDGPRCAGELRILDMASGQESAKGDFGVPSAWPEDRILLTTTSRIDISAVPLARDSFGSGYFSLDGNYWGAQYSPGYPSNQSSFEWMSIGERRTVSKANMGSFLVQSISPGPGKVLGISSSDSSTDLFEWNLASGSIRRLESWKSFAGWNGVYLAPDESWCVYTRNGSYSWDVRRRDFADGSETVLRQGNVASFGTLAAVSVIGTDVLIETMREGIGELYVVPVTAAATDVSSPGFSIEGGSAIRPIPGRPGDFIFLKSPYPPDSGRAYRDVVLSDNGVETVLSPADAGILRD